MIDKILKLVKIYLFNLKNKCNKAFYRMQTKLKNIISKFYQIIKKGPQHITIMIIPHSESRIFKLHISYFTLIFIGILIGIIIFFASFNILFISTSKQEVKNLSRLSKIWRNKEKIIRQSIEELDDEMEKLKPEIIKLYESTTTKYSYINLYAQGGSSEFDTQLLSSEYKRREKMPEEYYELVQLKHDIQLSKKYIERVKNFIKEREKVFSKLPSIWPLKVGGYITSGYGWRRNPFNRRKMEWHKWLDIASWPGAPIVATADGTVKFAGWKKGYGLTVIIKHAYGFETHYAHLSRIRVYSGKKVKRGQIIGFLGKSGLTTGYHLHYEVRIGLKDVNPWQYIFNIK